MFHETAVVLALNDWTPAPTLSAHLPDIVPEELSDACTDMLAQGQNRPGL